MMIIIELGILFIYCLGSLFFTRISASFLVALLLQITYSCLGQYRQDKSFAILSTIIYGVFSLFLPEALLFLPLLIYNLVTKEQLLLTGPFVLLFFYFWHDTGIFPMIFTGFGVLLSLFICYQKRQMQDLQERYYKERDEGRERELLLEQKNQALSTGQDAEIVMATLTERNRIAREIHDNVGHLLSRGILMTQALKVSEKDSQQTEALEALGETLTEAMNSVRSSVHDLHEDFLDLDIAVRELVKDFTFCPVTLEIGNHGHIPRDVKYGFLTSIKEGLNNIIRHSKATEARIIIQEHPGLYQLIISDNGPVINDDEEKGIGLLNMEERVRNLKGTLRILRAEGFQIQIAIPK
ncbi:sensor histidine kinase [Ohessyouella blattaphilus]|uniref:histidine kinase n=1 Tax=Ohessyouella blattaphilus TaxID=2949333 RepID=A0ABT1EEY9_9FIRM|nr:sensor histidine kinase [Ohessyouella blattaphilus]MCP1109271.1 sensor histidine kinase [Ohessyouella blattaphilus]MCR8562665.1 sensor histidine kinase [Ohessyouella blattaphilus]